MKILHTITETRAWRSATTGSIGIVPTMGYLHEGHLSLVRASRERDGATIATIFVNPAQFGANEDLSRYPRDEARDLALLDAEGVHAVFMPSVAEMYPDGYATYVAVEGLTERLEGASRPTHFRGVTTVVAKLLTIVRPDRAYFGQKDAQQLAVVRRMVADLDMAVDIVGMPIVREADGLAMSSRNVYLSPEQRLAALVLSQSLADVRNGFEAGERRGVVLRGIIESAVRAEPLAALDYASVADAGTLDEIATVDRPALVSLAVRFGGTRLIDNTVLMP